MRTPKRLQEARLTVGDVDVTEELRVRRIVIEPGDLVTAYVELPDKVEVEAQVVEVELGDAEMAELKREWQKQLRKPGARVDRSLKVAWYLWRRILAPWCYLVGHRYETSLAAPGHCSVSCSRCLGVVVETNLEELERRAGELEKVAWRRGR